MYREEWDKRPSSYPPHFKCIVHGFEDIVPKIYTYSYKTKNVYSQKNFLTQKEIKLIYDKEHKDDANIHAEVVDKVYALKTYSAMRFFADKFSNIIDTQSLPTELKELLINLSNGPLIMSKPSKDASLKTRAALVHLQYKGDTLFSALLKKYEHLDPDRLMSSIIEALSIVEGNTNQKFWILDKQAQMPVGLDSEFKDVPHYPVALRQLYDKALIYEQQAMQKAS